MSGLLQLLAVTAVIAGMVVLKMHIQRQLNRQRLAGRPGNDCEDTECFGGCGGHKHTDRTPT